MNLIGYIRVSTASQVEEGAGLEVQEEAIAAWCARNGHTLLTTHRDEGISGTKDAASRPGLAAALAGVKDLGAGLVVYKLDRLARTLTVQEAALAHAWSSGGRVFAVDVGEVMPDDPDDPMRTAMRQMVGVFAQLERAMVVYRLRSGRQHKKSKGGYAEGAPPFGQRAEGKELIPDRAEQAAITRIGELRATGLSLRAIGAQLEVEGHLPKRAPHWHPKVIGRILMRLGPPTVGS